MDISLALMTGVDIPAKQLQLIFHQPTLKEISYMGEETFFQALHYLCLKKEQLIQDKTLLERLTNFQVLMKVISQSESQEVKRNLITLLTLLFPSKKIAFTPNSLILADSKTENNVLIDDNNFQDFQDIIGQITCTQKLFQGDNVTYDAADEKAQAIIDKIMAGRKKIAAIKSAENKGSILARYISILSIGVSSMSLRDCINLTLYQLFDLVERYQLYANWDTTFRIKLAGGEVKQEVEDWQKNIH